MAASAVLRVLEAVALLVVLQSGSVAAQPADFGFRIEVGDCSPEKFDSFAGVFTKKLGVGIGMGPSEWATVKLTLNDSQMRRIYEGVQEIGFFDFARRYDGVPSGLNEVTITSPHDTYRLEVRNGGRLHVVEWKDAYKPTTEQAARFRALLLMIFGFIHDHPDFKRLPPVTWGCL